MKDGSKYFSSLSVKRKVQSIFFIAIFICLITAALFFYSDISMQITTTHKQQNKDKIQLVEQSANAIYENMDNLSKLIMFNNSVLTYLHTEKTNSQKSFSSDLQDISSDLQKAGNDIESLNKQLKAILNEENSDYESLYQLSEEMSDNTKALKELSISVLGESNLFDENEIYTVKNYNNYRNITDELQANIARSEIYNILNSFPSNHSVYIFKVDAYNKVDLKSLKTGIGVSVPVRWKLNDFWKKKVSNLKGGYYVAPNTGGQFDINTSASIVSFMRAINDMNTQQPIGMLVINFHDTLLEHTYLNYSDDTTGFAFIDESGNTVCSSIADNELAQILEKKDIFSNDECDFKINNRYINTSKLDNSNMILVCSSRFKIFSELPKDMILSAVFVIITILLTMIVINVYLNKYITSPLTKLSEAMKTVDAESPPKVEIDTYNDEIGRLKDCYNEMVGKINRLIDEVVRQEQERQKAEMKVIQEQIKPHFLYNTLEMIGCMALQSSGEEVYDIVETLGSFYRNFLNKGSENITIGQEVTIIRDYMKLLKLRHDDSFDFDDEYYIQEDLNSLITLKLILQPLVENAIYHGIRQKGEHGIVRISIYSDENNNVHFKVYDNGIGMSEEQVHHLLREKDDRSFGFQATINRIRNYYQLYDVVNIRSAEGEFCEIEIIIPIDRMR